MCQTTFYSLLIVGLLSLLDQTRGSGNMYVSMHVDSWINPSGQAASGQCCDAGNTGCTFDQCDPEVTACIVIGGTWSGGCDGQFNKKSLGPYTQMNSIPNFAAVSPRPGQNNPMIFTVRDWTSQPLSLGFSVADEDGPALFENIDTFQMSYNPGSIARNQNEVSYISQRLVGLRGFNPSELNVRVGAWCYENYYGSQCQVHCVPSTGCSGHFTCDPATGARLCSQGWLGPRCDQQDYNYPNFAVCPAIDRTAAPVIGSWMGYLDCSGSRVNLWMVVMPADNPTSTTNLRVYVAAQNYSVSGYYSGSGDYDSNTNSLVVTPNTGQYEMLPDGPFGLGLVFNPTTNRFSADGVITRGCTVDLYHQAIGGSNDYCYNGGTCFFDSNKPTCCCPDGYTGEFCERINNPCLPNPCGPGSCSISGGDAMCDCPLGYRGSNCQYVGSDITCDDNPCASSVCLQPAPNQNYEYSCPQCPQNLPPTCSISISPAPCSEFYYGPNCDIYCKPTRNCLGHFDCSQSGQRMCVNGWSGALCNVKTITPGSDPDCVGALGGCVNGFCSRESNECCCKPGWMGVNCIQDIDECRSYPCRNGATCQNLQNAYRCICAPGCSGVNCQTCGATPTYPPPPSPTPTLPPPDLITLITQIYGTLNTTPDQNKVEQCLAHILQTLLGMQKTASLGMYDSSSMVGTGLY